MNLKNFVRNHPLRTELTNLIDKNFHRMMFADTNYDSHLIVVEMSININQTPRKTEC